MIIAPRRRRWTGFWVAFRAITERRVGFANTGSGDCSLYAPPKATVLAQKPELRRPRCWHHGYVVRNTIYER